MFMFYQSEVFPHVQINLEKSQYSPVKNKQNENKQTNKRKDTNTNKSKTNTPSSGSPIRPWNAFVSNLK